MTNKQTPYDRWDTIMDRPYTTPGYHAYSSCTHNGDTALFEIEGRAFHPVNSAGAKAVQGMVACVDLAGIFTRLTTGAFVDPRDSTLPGSEALAAIANRQQGPPVLRLDWPDFGVPPSTVGVAFWRLLIETLPVGKIAVGCIGSHGRTGTFLSALRILYFQQSAPNAINWVRAHHCTKAVESTTQETYLWRLAKTVGTDTQPYDTALAARVNGQSPRQEAGAPRPFAPAPPSPITLPQLALEEIIYLTADQQTRRVSVTEWAQPGYFSTQFRQTTRSESRILLYA